MKRDILKNLIDWKNKIHRMPLLLRGARQVGKTFIVEWFGKKYFDDFVKVDFELNPEAAICFQSLDPQKILASLEIHLKRKIIPGKTLLFLDEIQICPNAIMSLRYFKENMSHLHVIGAGSLLEFTLNDPDFKMPVGRVQYLFLKPLSFYEYLHATGNEIFLDRLREITFDNTPSEIMHLKGLELVKEYMAIGGMPAAVSEFISTNSFRAVQEIQSIILNTYRDDFGKYAKKTQYKTLRLLFEKSPGLIGQWFKYSKVDPLQDPRSIRDCLEQLKDAGLIYYVHATSATGLPLITTANQKKFKLLFLDIGLANRASHLDLEVILHGDIIQVNQGFIAEQFVGQELMAYLDHYEQRYLYFWVREKTGSSAEVDYIINVGASIIPIEVKSGSSNRLKSLRIFMEEKNCELGIKVSQAKFSYESQVLSLPIYMIGELQRLVQLAGKGNSSL